MCTGFAGTCFSAPVACVPMNEVCVVSPIEELMALISPLGIGGILESRFAITFMAGV